MISAYRCQAAGERDNMFTGKIEKVMVEAK